jgi:hypothetical protein
VDIIDLLASDNYIIANKTIAHLYGLEEAVLLGELASEYKYWKRRDELKDGYFYSTVENVKENTTLSDKRQRSALTTLKEAGIVTVKLMGIPAKRYIKIEVEKVFELLMNKSGENGKSSSSEMAELEPPKTEINNNNKNNKNNNKEEIEEKPKRKRFVPPTLEEVEAYCRERNNGVDAKKFYDYFSANDWVDSKGNKVKSWKQKVITWEGYSTNKPVRNPVIPEKTAEQKQLDNDISNMF